MVTSQDVVGAGSQDYQGDSQCRPPWDMIPHTRFSSDPVFLSGLKINCDIAGPEILLRFDYVLLSSSRRSKLHQDGYSKAEALRHNHQIVVSDGNMSEIGMHMQKHLMILQVCLCRVRPDYMLVRAQHHRVF